MKKILALALAMLMALSIFACAAGGGGDSEPGSNVASNDTPKEDLVDSGAGYPTDDVDHKARDTYEFVYAFTASSALTDSMMNSWALMEDQYNFTVTESSGEGDQ